MDTQEQIISFMAQEGPVLPGKIAKLINTNLLLASAHLSDLASQGKVKISYLKVGGSPLYYLQGQEEQLEKYAPNNLNPKDVAVMEELKREAVLREVELELLPRVALRSLKDFAVPLNVRTPQGQELFWKWHALPMEEANVLIGKHLEKVAEEIAAQRAQPAAPAPASAPAPSSLAISAPPPILATAPSPPVPLAQISPLGEQQQLISSPSENKGAKKRSKLRKKIEDDFLPQLHEFFKELHIQIEEQQLLRKNAEAVFVVRVPSVVGKMKYFCRAKRKNVCDEKDISSAYMEAQMKKVPLLFLYSGELSKKAKEMLEAGAFENGIVKKIENFT